MTMTTAPNNVGHFGDTTFTKVFVGGLAWETPKEILKDHFDEYGDILEAVIISDKLTGRSKGYGFVTFKEAEAAKRACEDASPVINGRRANCNLASLGARRPTASSTPPPHNGQGGNGGALRSSPPTPQASHVQWYYPPYHHHHHQHHHPLPYFGYTPTAYVSTDVGTYHHKVSYNGGQYYSPGVQSMAGANTLMPVYGHHHHPGPSPGPGGVYYHHHHQSQQLGMPAAAHHIYSLPLPTVPITKLPPVILSKPTSTLPTPVCLAVE